VGSWLNRTSSGGRPLEYPESLRKSCHFDSIRFRRTVHRVLSVARRARTRTTPNCAPTAWFRGNIHHLRGVALVATSKSRRLPFQQKIAHATSDQVGLEPMLAQGFSMIEIAKFLDISGWQFCGAAEACPSKPSRRSESRQPARPPHLRRARYRILLFSRFCTPRPFGGVFVGDARNCPCAFSTDNAAMTIQSLLEIIHRFLRRHSGKIPCATRSAVHLS